ncbi:MAG: methyltransferase domain-containing protein [Chlorobi bacterium]|nr:methyltransferase domain-containing protein [Chlorobiota bacterium]
MKKDFNPRYETGDLPWDIKRPDFNLKNIVKSRPVEPCKALDIGCGTGDNVIWLAREGFETLGIDMSSKAIEMAKDKAVKTGVETDFRTMDFLGEKLPANTFGFVFDRGCFHTFDEKEDRKVFVENVHGLLMKDGLWLSLIGNYDDGRLDIGPPKRKALEVVEIVEPYFEILSIVQGRFDSNDEIPSKIWVCLMRKRSD